MQSLSWKRPVYGMPKKWVHSTKNENSFTNFKVCKFYSLIFQNLAMNSSEENMSNILYYTIIMLYITILYFTIYLLWYISLGRLDDPIDHRKEVFCGDGGGETEGPARASYITIYITIY